MKPSIFLSAALALFVLCTSALAATGTCIDTNRNYEAHTKGRSEIVLRSTIGKPRPPLLLSTSCNSFDKPDHVAVSTQFNCVGLGDTVVVTKIDGHSQSCRVTRVAPYVPAETPAQP